MNSIEVINEALPTFLQYRNLEDEELLDIFIKKGFKPDTARKIVIFIPLAFGRIILNDLGVSTSDEFEFIQKNDIFTDKKVRNLNTVEVFRESFKIASEIFHNDNETFWAVAGRSAEISAVNQMKAQGSQPQNIVLTSMLTMWELEEESPQIEAKPIQNNKINLTQSKNWWEFWK